MLGKLSRRCRGNTARSYTLCTKTPAPTYVRHWMSMVPKRWFALLQPGTVRHLLPSDVGMKGGGECAAAPFPTQANQQSFRRSLGSPSASEAHDAIREGQGHKHGAATPHTRPHTHKPPHTQNTRTHTNTPAHPPKRLETLLISPRPWLILRKLLYFQRNFPKLLENHPIPENFLEGELQYVDLLCGLADESRAVQKRVVYI